eukprot:14523230-Alexandrium_andersonii.AAC.1
MSSTRQSACGSAADAVHGRTAIARRASSGARLSRAARGSSTMGLTMCACADSRQPGPASSWRAGRAGGLVPRARWASRMLDPSQSSVLPSRLSRPAVGASRGACSSTRMRSSRRRAPRSPGRSS